MSSPGEPEAARTEANPTPDRSAPAPSPSPAAASDTGSGPIRVGWIGSLLAALFAGIVAWAGGEKVEAARSVRLVSEFQVSGGQQLAERAAAITTKATLSYGLAGAALGLTLGLAGGIARRSRSTVAMIAGAGTGGVAGLLLGAIAGAGSASLAVPFFLRNEDTTVADDLILPLLTHGAIWSALGAAGGLALGIGLRATPSLTVRLTLGGLFGALIATTVYELIGGLAFPFDQTGQPISAGSGSRLFARLVLAIAVTAGAILPTRRIR
jgi:hypothetical protein